MLNLNALKDKLGGLKAKLAEKTDKIAFLKNWRERRATKQPSGAAGKPSDPHSLNAIYREGTTGTRLQVIAFYLFILVALVSAGSLAKKIAVKLRFSTEHEKLKQDYTHELAEAKRKVLERAEILSLGEFTANIYVGAPAETKMMSVDLWIKVSDPEVAALVNSRIGMFHDRTTEALNALFVSKVNLLQEEGKVLAKEKIRNSLNSALHHGRVEEVFIQNFVVQ